MPVRSNQEEGTSRPATRRAQWRALGLTAQDLSKPKVAVVVPRGQGPLGSPGIGMAPQLIFALDGAELTARVAVVTDGQLSGRPLPEGAVLR